jgi:hypothetical protein
MAVIETGHEGSRQVRVTLTVAGGASDPARELAGSLGATEQLRGRVHLVDRPGQQGALGEAVVSVVVDLAPPVFTACATALIAWLRHRTSDARVTVRRADGARVELSARRVRNLGPAELAVLVDQVAKHLGPALPTADTPSRAAVEPPPTADGERPPS